MNKRILLALAVLAGGLILSPKSQAFQHVDLDPGFVSEVENIFNVADDATAFNLDLVSDEDPNLRLLQEAEIYVTFIHERAFYKNQFGYFTFEDTDHDGVISPDEVLDEQLIFANVSEDDGTLAEGDTAKLGPFPAGTQIGFFIVANGYLDPKGTYYTLNELNPDHKPHMAMVATRDGGNVAIGIEDKPWGHSDLDFNDVIFTFTTTPDTALDQIIEDSNIPVNEVPGDDVEEETPAQEPGDEVEPPAEGETPEEEPVKVCFCHNIHHHPHTICTADEGLINGHMAHVNGEVPGVQDSLGPCEVEETPGDEGETPEVEPTPPAETPAVEEPSEDPTPGDDTPEVEEPGEDPTPGDVEEEVPPSDDSDDSETGVLPEPTKVDGFEPGSVQEGSEIGGGAPAKADVGMYFEGSGCSLASAATGNGDLFGWALLAGLLMISPLRRILG